MSILTLEAVAAHMRDIDFGMLSTRTASGCISSRPMSNNGQVDYDGDSYFFSFDSAGSIDDIAREASVGLTFTGTKSLLGKPPFFVAIEGNAELIRDKSQFAAHWVDELKQWFKDGVDTPGLILIKVHARRLHYWNGDDNGEITL